MYSRGAHIFVAPALTSPRPSRQPCPLQLFHSCRCCSQWRAITSAGGCNKRSTDGLIVFVQSLAATVCQTAQGNMIWASVSVFDRQHDMIQCLGVWSTISQICDFRYCMHPKYISVTCDKGYGVFQDIQNIKVQTIKLMAYFCKKTGFSVLICTRRYTYLFKGRSVYEYNVKKVHALFYEQCAPRIRIQLEVSNGYNGLNIDQYSVALL